MSPKEIFDKLVQKAAMCKSIFYSGRHNGKGYDPSQPRTKPGYLIESCSDEDRKLLQQLTSKDTENPDKNHLIYTCDEYYNKKEEKEKWLRLEKEWDNKIFKRRS